MEVDTGASMSLMPETTYRRLWPGRSLSATSVRLSTYSKEPIPVVGSTQVQVAYEGQSAQLPLIVVQGEGPILLGRNWLQKIQLNWNKIHYTPSAGLEELLGRFPEIFQEGRGTLQGFEAKIHVDPGATPRFCRARTVPYAMRGLVEEELSRLVTELRSFLGLLTYYGKFLLNLSTLLAPLYKLLRKGVSWQWGNAQDGAFRKSKKLLSSSPLLCHFDSKVPLTLACDASAYGIGAVLAHRLPDGSEKPTPHAL